MDQKARHPSRWLAVITIPIVAAVAYAVVLLPSGAGCSGHHGWTIQWIWPLAGIGTAIAVSLAVRAGERVAVVVVYWGAAHGCWS